MMRSFENVGMMSCGYRKELSLLYTPLNGSTMEYKELRVSVSDSLSPPLYSVFSNYYEIIANETN